MPRRRFTEDEVAWITTSPRTISSANISVECPVCRKLHKLQLSLDPNKPLKDGYVRLPEDDMLRCCGKSFDMSDIRNNFERFYGWPDYNLKYLGNIMNN